MKRYTEQLHNNIDGGLAHNMNPQDIADQHQVDISVILNQLEKGIQVEYEHTYNTEIAKEIAMDHLVEYPYYYDELEQMEKKFEYIRGKEMKRYKSVFNKVKEDEEDKSVKAVKDLIDLDWEADEDSKHKAVAMIQGLFTADTKVGNDFLKQLSDFTSGLKIEDFKEGCKKNPKKKDMKEAFRFSNPNTASSILQDSIVYLSNYYDITHPKFIRSVAFAILNGLTASVEHKFISDENNDPSNEKKQNKLVKTTLSKIFSYIKGRI